MTPIYLDVETTGLSHKHCAVLEVAAVATDGDGELDTFHSLCHPGERALSDPRIKDALAINKLEFDEIRSAPPIIEVADRLRKWLSVWGASTLHAYNNQFDAGFLTESPWKLNPLSWGQCVMKAVARGKRWCKLKDAASRFGLEWDESQAHGALYDAKMAFRVHRAYLKHNGLVRV